MIYDIKIPQPHLIALLQLLEQVPAPLSQTLPIYENLRTQRDRIDEASALVVHNPDT